MPGRDRRRLSVARIDVGNYTAVMFLGSKAASGAREAIIAQMPPHDTFIETHFGTGAIMRAKPPAVRSIAVEIDPATFATYRPDPAIAEAINGDCVAFLKGFDFASAGRVLVYMDPPYLAATRTSDKRYRFEMTDQDHIALLAIARSLPAAVMISGYPSDLYDRELVGWRSIRFQVMTRGGPRTECLWMNFEAGDVHWSRFAGKNFTDRQRIKRKAARWAANFQRLPAGERLAILAAIMTEIE